MNIQNKYVSYCMGLFTENILKHSIISHSQVLQRQFFQWITYHYFWRIERQWYSLYLLLLRRNLCKETLKEMKHWLNDNPLSIAAVITCQITFVLSHCCVDLWKFMQEVNLNICYFKIEFTFISLFLSFDHLYHTLIISIIRLNLVQCTYIVY